MQCHLQGSLDPVLTWGLSVFSASVSVAGCNAVASSLLSRDLGLSVRSQQWKSSGSSFLVDSFTSLASGKGMPHYLPLSVSVPEVSRPSGPGTIFCIIFGFYFGPIDMITLLFSRTVSFLFLIYPGAGRGVVLTACLSNATQVLPSC